VLRPTALPWRKPRRELLLLALVALAALSPVYVTSTQDETRLCLSRSLVHGRLTIQPCAGNTIDQAYYGGQVYTDKAPGLSALAVPAVAATRLPPASKWVFEGDLQLWAVRLATSGLAFLLLAWMVGRMSEGLAPGYGGLALVAFALGTLVAPMAATGFDHDLTAAFGFAAFVLAWRGSTLAAGLCAGIALCSEYQAGVIGLLVGAFVLARGLRPLALYAVGAVPPVLGLAAYDWSAFGSPFHPSYRYVANKYSAEQSSGLLGIHAPSAHAVREVFVGDRGLLVCSPVLVAAAAGLVLVAGRHRLAALVCAAVAAVFVVANCGYFLPYGGISPGPRFLIPALPFLAVGLGPAFARWRVVTSVLAAVSIVATTAVTLTWALLPDGPYPGTIWTAVGRVFTEGTSSALVRQLAKNVLVWAGPNRIASAAVVGALSAAAFLVASAEPWTRRRGDRVSG
jgi:hypothetical protein